MIALVLLVAAVVAVFAARDYYLTREATRILEAEIALLEHLLAITQGDAAE